jgi:hypothetical protein
MLIGICYICFDDLNEDCCKLECDHKYCNMCIFNYIKNKIDECETKICCPTDWCETANFKQITFV